MTLRPHHLPLLHHVHRTLVYGAVGLVPQPVLVALHGEGGGEEGAVGEADHTKGEGRKRI